MYAVWSYCSKLLINEVLKWTNWFFAYILEVLRLYLWYPGVKWSHLSYRLSERSERSEHFEQFKLPNILSNIKCWFHRITTHLSRPPWTDFWTLLGLLYITPKTVCVKQTKVIEEILCSFGAFRLWSSRSLSLFVFSPETIWIYLIMLPYLDLFVDGRRCAHFLKIFWPTC